MDGFYTDEIEKILGFPDTAERPDNEVFSVIFSLGMDAENREEVEYTYNLLISLTEKKSADVRAYALASLAIMAVQKNNTFSVAWTYIRDCRTLGEKIIIIRFLHYDSFVS